MLPAVRTRGRAAKPVHATVVRPLDETDLKLLGTEKGSTPSALKRISERHHMLARILAGGATERDASVVCGLSLSRVSILKADPAFQNLLSFYREGVQREYLETHRKAAELSGLAIDIMMDRLETEEEKVTFGQLLDTAKTMMDRTGHGPSSQTTNVSVNVDIAARMQRGRERAEQRKRQEVIEGHAIRLEE